ncbi:hypothetical protein [Aeoliella mucimassa]|uniref:Uncharacterized protein n=1 Tax=Aeoliella mucimassa TaxID=2527972 RepID=A0A518AWL6_9BACT|nr:hypothetical protein [Aeoliella mucimassa]QDU59127.1 hypothetical protein Pan181_53680 [Aeoliella mucimassa]
MLSDVSIRYRQYRAPRTNNSVVAIPPLAEVSTEVDMSVESLSLADTTLGQLREAARRELLEAATRYTANYLPGVPTIDPHAPLLLTGHQAELFHPGVWFKNFALSRLAAEHQAVGIHLVIDTDAAHSSNVRVPTDSVAAPRIESVPFDAATSPMPVEEKRIVDRAMFESFGQRVADTLAPLVADPLVKQWWPTVVQAVERTNGNGHLAIAQARHQLEHAWGATTLELPMSQACELSVFAPFAAAMLVDSSRLWQAYNDALHAFRTAHRLRSDAQPMPDLAKEDDWLEMPFWVWSADDPVRRALFVRQLDGQLELTNRAGWNLTARCDMASQLSEQLAELGAAGIKLRTRALTTTLFARLVLGDVFLHGIGGAKYDEVADDLVHRLWGIVPPAYVALSATMHLPIEHRSVSSGDLQRVAHYLRDWQWHPENWLDSESDSVVEQALSHKRHWLALPKTEQNAAERHQAIHEANAALRQATDEVRQRLEREQAELEEQYRASQVLESREYSFCLFPADDLRERMTQLVQQA